MHTIKDLNAYVQTLETKGVHLVKPRVILQQVEGLKDFGGLISLPFPPSLIGSIPVFDAVILAAILKLRRPFRVLEFGTYLGYSTRVILENSSPECSVFTVDLPHGADIGDESLKVTDYELHTSAALNDNFLRQLQFHAGARYLAALSEVHQSRLTQIKADTRNLDSGSLLRMLGGRCDLIFIDGGHDYETVTSDTKLALEVASDDATVVWHDYGSKIHTDVTRFVDNFSSSCRVVSVTGTLLAMLHLGSDPILHDL